MALDTSLARDLVAELQAQQPFSKPATVVYSNRDIVEPSSAAVIRVGIGGPNERKIVSRNSWATDATVRVTITGQQQMDTTAEVATTETDVDDWLTFVDEVVNQVQELKPNSRPATFIEFEDRFDTDLMRNENIFLTTFLVTYRYL